MEVLFMVALMIVPIMSVIALVMSLVSFRRLDALKRLVIDLSDLARKDFNPAEKLLENYKIESA